MRLPKLSRVVRASLTLYANRYNNGQEKTENHRTEGYHLSVQPTTDYPGFFYHYIAWREDPHLLTIRKWENNISEAGLRYIVTNFLSYIRRKLES